MNSHVGNPFADHDLIASYEGWYETAGRRADALEKRLLDELLTDFPALGTVLEVGCGMGGFTRSLLGRERVVHVTRSGLFNLGKKGC